MAGYSSYYKSKGYDSKNTTAEKAAANLASKSSKKKDTSATTAKTTSNTTSNTGGLANTSLSALKTLSDLKGIQERGTDSEKALATKQIESWNKSYGADTSISKADLDSYITAGKEKTGTSNAPVRANLVPMSEASQSSIDAQEKAKTMGVGVNAPNFGKTAITGAQGVGQMQTGLTQPNQTANQVGQILGGTTTLQAQLEEQQRKATMASLDKARNESLAALNTEATELTPQYAEARSQARATSARAGKSFSEFMAQRGLSSSGGSALGETMRTGALQGSLSSLSTQEQAALNDIASRRSALESSYQSDIASAEANLQAQSLATQIAQQEQLRQEALAQEEADKQNYVSTIGQYIQNYQAEIDRVANDGDTSNDWQIPYLAAARQQKIATQNLDPTTGAQLAQQVELTPTSALALWKQTGTATPEIASALGIEEGRRYTTASTGGSGGTKVTAPKAVDATYYANYNELLNSLERVRLSGQEAIDWIAHNGQTLSDRFTPDVVNQVTQDIVASMQPQEQATQEPYDPSSVNEYEKRIGSLYTSKDVDGNIVYDTEGIRTYLSKLHDQGYLTDAQFIDLGYAYNLK